MKKQHGFCLLELMIVVAIIGILVALVVPPFVDLAKKQKAARQGRSGVHSEYKDGYRLYGHR